MNTSSRLGFRILEQKSPRGCRAIPSQWTCTDAIRNATRASPRERLFGFRNRKITASAAKEEAYTILRCVTEVEMYRADPTGSQPGLHWGKGLYWEHLRPLFGRLKRALRMEQRLTVEKFHQLLQLSEAIIDYARMIQAYNQFPVPNAIVEIPELAHRFRETPQTIQAALRLLRDIGRAEPADLSGCWILRLAGTPPGGREGVHSTTRHSHTNIEKPKRSYVRPQMSRLLLAEARTKLQAELIPGDLVGQEMLRRIEQFVMEICQGIKK